MPQGFTTQRGPHCHQQEQGTTSFPSSQNMKPPGLNWIHSISSCLCKQPQQLEPWQKVHRNPCEGAEPNPGSGCIILRCLVRLLGDNTTGSARRVQQPWVAVHIPLQEGEAASCFARPAAHHTEHSNCSHLYCWINCGCGGQQGKPRNIRQYTHIRGTSRLSWLEMDLSLQGNNQ